MDRVAFQTLLAQRKVAWAGSTEDALDDMQAARAAIRTDCGRNRGNRVGPIPQQ
jgi:hypothetical protein